MLRDCVDGLQHGLQLRYLKQDVLGFAVYTDERLPGELYDKVIHVIQLDLEEILRILPQIVVRRLLSFPIHIWVNLDNGAGKKGCCCHCIDLPKEYMACKAHSIEIFDIKDFLEQSAVQPAQLLHEVSHWFHHDITQQELLSQQGEHGDRWMSSAGHVTKLGPWTKQSGGLCYRMSSFRNHCLNGIFVLEDSGLRFHNPQVTLVQQDQRGVLCRCTDRWSTVLSQRPDRWHLELNGTCLAYRLGTDFGMSVGGWIEWTDEWMPSEGLVEAVAQDQLMVGGFSQNVLNGEYVLKASLDCYLSGCLGGIWMNRIHEQVLLRFTNRYSHWSDGEAPFDRWHLEIRGFGCKAYLCDVDATVKGWREAVESPTDQLIFQAHLSSLPLYSRSCERVGRKSCEPHYAATNHKEYFAECSEAYFSSQRFRNDYFPYIHEELKAYDPVGYAMCEKIWGPRTASDEIEARYFREFSPKGKVRGFATQLATSDDKRKFLAMVSRFAHGRRQQILSLAT